MESTPSGLQAGAAQADITPSWPIYLDGMGREFVSADGTKHAYDARDQQTTTTHDPLTLQAVYLTDGTANAIILSADLLYPVAWEEVAAAVAEACEISKAFVFYASTHNHNGPSRTDEYAALLCEKAVACAREAMANARPVSVQRAQGHYDRLMHNRQAPWEPIYPGIDILSLRDKSSGEPLCTLWNYGCHPCSLDWDFNEISADYPGAIRRHVAQTTGSNAPLSFLIGCAGNIQATGMRRFVDPPQMYFGVPKGDIEMVERFGECVAAEGLRALDQTPVDVPVSALTVRRFALALPVRLHMSREELRARHDNLDDTMPLDAARGKTPLHIEAVKILQQWMAEILEQEPAAPPVRRSDVGLVAFGDTAIVFVPHEVGWQLGEQIRRRSPYAHTLISTCSLGFESYIVDRHFYEMPIEERPYEAHGMAAMAGYSYEPAAPEIFVDRIVAELVELHDNE